MEGLSAVTVLHHDPVRADGASTALMLAGPDGWHEMAAQLGITRILLITPDGTIHLTESIQEQVRLEDEPDAGVRVWPDP